MNHQNELFENTTLWEEEWQGMPEYAQERKDAVRELTVKFSSEKDFEDFMDIVGQRFTSNTKLIWYPQKLPTDQRVKDLVYTDES